MKRIILVLAALLFAAATMNAQVANVPASSNASSLQYNHGNLFQNGNKLTSSQALQVLGNEVYANSYKPAKGLRTAGIVMVSAGSAITALGAGLLIGGVASDSVGDTLLAMPAVYLIGGGVAVAAVGGILWGVGNKKMKKIVPASSGAGVAVNF